MPLLGQKLAPRITQRLALTARHDFTHPRGCRRCGVRGEFGHLVDCIPGRRVINCELEQATLLMTKIRRYATTDGAHYGDHYTRLKAAEAIRASLGWVS